LQDGNSSGDRSCEIRPPTPPTPPGFELAISCIELGDGETLQFPPNTYSKQVEAAKKLLGEREAVLKKIQERLFAKNVALTLGGSLLAALIVYGIFASLGWALAGFAND
jgi:hypothetical protein